MSPSAVQMHRFRPGADAPSADRPTSSPPPWADVTLVSDGDSKNDEVDAGAQQVDAQQATIAEGRSVAVLIEFLAKQK